MSFLEGVVKNELLWGPEEYVYIFRELIISWTGDGDDEFDNAADDDNSEVGGGDDEQKLNIAWFCK